MAESQRLDDLIRQWFLAPREGLHGCAPRDLIWAEQMGRPNPIHPDRIAEFLEDGCPVCQFEHKDLKTGARVRRGSWLSLALPRRRLPAHRPLRSRGPRCALGQGGRRVCRVAETAGSR